MDKKKKSFSNDWFTKGLFQWQKSLNGVPDFDIVKLKNYLIDSRDKSFDKDRVKAYKSLKAYKYFEEGFVQQLRHADFEDGTLKLYLIHAKVLASYQGKSYQTYVAVDKSSGCPVGGACACVAGRGEACSHIAAILFAVEDYVAKGLDQLPDDPTCTEQLCAWNKPSKQNVEPETIHNIRIVKQLHGKVHKQQHTFDSIAFDPRQISDRDIDLARKSELISALKTSNPKCNFLRYQSKPSTSNSDATPKPKIPSLEDYKIDMFPPSLSEIECKCVEAMNNVYSVSSEQIHRLERLTIGQSDSAKWRKARKYRLTASNFHKVFRMKLSTNPRVTIETLLYKTARQTSAMAFGIQMEEDAARRYTKKTGKKLLKRGLVVDKEFPFLGASVDRVTEDKSKIIEIKNPHSTWNMDIEGTVKKLKCLKYNENNEIELNTNHEYYTQVQGQMGILGIHKCDFVLCTELDMVIVKVIFDDVFWEQCKKKLISFYKNLILPEILYPRVKYGLEPFKYEIKAKDVNDNDTY